ncbi:MAG: two-component sensor histidine kinase [Nitrospirales bacterium]|nr:MAG: two-component sensor histidine kinase [Nitrospirales bacterium]
MKPGMPIFRRVWPQRLTSQMIALLLVALVLAQVANFLIFTDERRAAIRSVERTQILERTASLIDLIAHSPSGLHNRMVQAASSRKLYYWLSDTSQIPQGLQQGDHEWISRLKDLLNKKDVSELRFMLPQQDGLWKKTIGEAPEDVRRSILQSEKSGSSFPLPLSEFDAPGLLISARLQDGRWLNVGMGITPSLGRWALPTLISMVFTGGSICLIVVFMVQRLTRPLQQLTEVAERVGRGESITPIPEEGPVDIQQTIHAFNRMYERLQRFVQDRTGMLAAISHDLRSPITSLRLQVELMKDQEARGKMLDTLEDMQRMTEATLAFSRDEASTEETRSVDLSALIDSLCQDLADMEMEVQFESAKKTPYTCRPISLKRAVRNLLENAVSYGGQVEAKLRQNDTEFQIMIQDKGPGIPEQDFERVFQPFVRLEESRNKQTGGIGLGMAIARSIVRNHGGDISLTNTPGGGLMVTIHLPALPLQQAEDQT